MVRITGKTAGTGIAGLFLAAGVVTACGGQPEQPLNNPAPAPATTSPARGTTSTSPAPAQKSTTSPTMVPSARGQGADDSTSGSRSTTGGGKPAEKDMGDDEETPNKGEGIEDDDEGIENGDEEGIENGEDEGIENGEDEGIEDGEEEMALYRGPEGGPTDSIHLLPWTPGANTPAPILLGNM